MRSRARLLAALLASLLAMLAETAIPVPHRGAGALAATSREPIPNAESQDAIRRVARARGEEDLAAALGDLRRASAPDFSDLVPQLALFLPTAGGEREGMAPAVIADRLGITRGQILRGVEPYLETSNEKIRAQLENLLGAVDHGSGDTADFGEYRAFLSEGSATPPLGLVRYMFSRSPADAVRVLAEIHGRSSGDAATGDAATGDVALVEETRRALASKGRVPDDTRVKATRALDALSRHPDWWVRCYAGAIARDERLARLSDPAMLERLANDPDERVRSTRSGEAPARD